MAKVYSPNKSFNGEVANVPFIDGCGEVFSPYLVDYFTRKGFIIEEEKPKQKPVKPVKADEVKKGSKDKKPVKSKTTKVGE